ncbi:hypothetical protein [Streptomyces sp. V4I8]|uniref:hypothetical protein n=1 Tax=Streptomyces sp. V4I8 TaxID=3156469 RepID=UPI003519CFCC
MPTDRLQVTRPLDKHAPDTGDDTVLKQAEAVVVNRCLRDLGHLSIRSTPLDERAVAEPEANIYEFLWFPEAKQSGYFLQPDATATRTEKKLLSGKWRPIKVTRSPRTDATGKSDAN